MKKETDPRMHSAEHILNQTMVRMFDCGRSFNGSVQLLRSYSKMIKQTEQEALWQLKYRSFGQVKREMGVRYASMRRLMEKEIDGKHQIFYPWKKRYFWALMSIALKRQELAYMITEVKKRRVFWILQDDRIATLKDFLLKIPKGKVK